MIWFVVAYLLSLTGHPIYIIFGCVFCGVLHIIKEINRAGEKVELEQLKESFIELCEMNKTLNKAMVDSIVSMMKGNNNGKDNKN